MSMRHPDHQFVFVFDNSSNHGAKGATGLCASDMNASPGGQQRRMRDTEWTPASRAHPRFGQLIPQRMVFGPQEEPWDIVQKRFRPKGGSWAGLPKGLKQVLRERGLFEDGMDLAEMVEVLAAQPDFMEEKSGLETVIVKASHRMILLPAYHCELNPIERIWANAKLYLRSHCQYTYPALRTNFAAAMTEEKITPSLVHKVMRKARENVRAYMLIDAKEAAAAMDEPVAAEGPMTPEMYTAQSVRAANSYKEMLVCMKTCKSHRKGTTGGVE
jgi:hypothetical protein